MGTIELFGIPGSELLYQKVLPDQDIFNEFQITHSFLKDIIDKKKLSILSKSLKQDISFQFINYGDTQLVYVLTVDSERFALLIGQPATKFGEVKREFDNLIFLSMKNPEYVIRPIGYTCNNYRELYFSPYILQARCIASQEIGWGIYIPEPYYHFEPFSKDNNEQEIVNSCMIALLIKMFDVKSSLGISSCKIGGGDFILEKEWSSEPLSYDNTLRRLKLIAARSFIKTELCDYINLIRNEFSKRTYYLKEDVRDKSIILNMKSRVPMTKEEIEKGIELGLKLRKEI